MSQIPDTQIQSWNDIQPKLGTKQQQVLSAVRSLKEGTGAELAEELNWELYRTLPRINELAKLSLVVDSGKRRINPRSGKKTIVWTCRERQ